MCLSQAWHLQYRCPMAKSVPGSHGCPMTQVCAFFTAVISVIQGPFLINFSATGSQHKVHSPYVRLGQLNLAQFSPLHSDRSLTPSTCTSYRFSFSFPQYEYSYFIEVRRNCLRLEPDDRTKYCWIAARMSI